VDRPAVEQLFEALGGFGQVGGVREVGGDVGVALVARALRRDLVARAGDRPPAVADEIGGRGVADAAAGAGDEDDPAVARGWLIGALAHGRVLCRCIPTEV
jgi:hypothetical protein